MTDISIIIPTQVSTRRGSLLLRAIDSVTGRQEKPAVPIIVANGTGGDPELLRALEMDRRIRFFFRAGYDVAKARHFGRRMVDTAYFGFLDDDDEYLPGVLSRRSAPLSADAYIDAVVSNGIRIVGDMEHLYFADMGAVSADPANRLMAENWLASCGGLFRTETVGPEYFPDDISHLEWTYTALRLALSRRIAFVDEPTFIVHDTPASLSKSRAYFEEHPRSIQRMLEINAPPAIRRKLRIKLIEALHALADRNRQDGYLRAAWACHLRSLGDPVGFLRYGLFTRRMIGTSLSIAQR